MIEITFDKSKMEAFLTDFKKLKNMTDDVIYQATMDSVLDVHNTAIRSGYAPYQTGTLRRSLTVAMGRAKGQVVGAVGTNLVYARIQEFGGNAGRNKKTHITGKFYITRAVEDNMKKIQDRFTKYLTVKNML